jgi:hypothetical protein
MMQCLMLGWWKKGCLAFVWEKMGGMFKLGDMTALDISIEK